MLDHTQDLWDALGDTHVRSYVYGQTAYQGATVDLSLAPEGGITWQASGEVQASGSMRALGFGDSLVPRSPSDMLATFGQETTLFRVVELRGSQTATIPLGIYRHTDNDGGRERTRQGRVLDWDATVGLADRMRMLQRAKIVNPGSPPAGATMYSELRRLLPFPLVATLPDQPVPRALVYENRIVGVRDLAAIVGGVLRINRQGNGVIRVKDRWLTETVPDFDIRGTISWEDGQSDEFYNYVLASSTDGVFSAVAALDDDSNPRSVGRAGQSDYELSTPVVVSQAGAVSAANTSLERLLYRSSRTMKVEVGAQGLLLELGDVGWVREIDEHGQQTRAVLGEVSGIRISHDPTQTIGLDLIVAEEA